MLQELANECINDLPTSLRRLSAVANGGKHTPQVVDYSELTFNKQGIALANRLHDAFNKYGSDKGGLHDYHQLYGQLLSWHGEQPSIMEIGIGSTNLSIPSNMGVNGSPGAALHAFREVLPNASLFGADIDDKIHIAGVKIYQIDQRRYETLAAMAADAATEFDLIIDDGLHAPNANLNTLAMGLTTISNNGAIVIEDIPPRAAEFWAVVAELLAPTSYECILIKMRISYVFVVVRSGSRVLSNLRADNLVDFTSDT